MNKLAIVVLLFLISMGCKEKTAKPFSNHELGKKRLEAKTLTEFSAIGERLDTLVNGYSELKYDSIEAIDFMFESMRLPSDTFPIDTILNRQVLDLKQSNYLMSIIDSKQTYANAIPAMCFEPHMIFVFYREDTIVAYYSVCLGCMKVYSTIKSKEIPFRYGLGEYGGSLFSEICQELHFSHCEYSKLPR
jgi:hypothetical protein